MQKSRTTRQPFAALALISAGAEGGVPASLPDVSAYGSKQGDLIRESSWLIAGTEKWTMRKTTGLRKSLGEKIV